MRGRDLRQEFLDFFDAKGHQVVRSSSLVPDDDPSLLFVNAGMVQFKEVFLGRKEVPYRRAVTAQRCLRVGGKHNDLEHVGHTGRHNTFFEMLGNFSFGDYFKEEAIAYAWELLVSRLGLDQNALWVTVHHQDDEARKLWPRITGISRDRVVGLGDKDNFWSMGDTGPCGPCSEIIIDRGQELACGPDCFLGECDCDRWLELWNLVFMQYNRDAQGELSPLPEPSIDTGMSLERMASVLQGVATNYETDLLWPLIERLCRETGREYDQGPEGLAFRVIADHLRACTFLVADGVLPRNEGRGYVLRRVLRRAVRMGKSLGFSEPFLHTLVPVALEIMEEAYPEAMERQHLISSVLKAEEERFLSVLESGLVQLEELVAEARKQGRGALSGREAFQLYDTFGFPIDLTEDVAQEAGLEVDRDEFESMLEHQKKQARQAGLGQRAPQVDLGGEKQEFVGYDQLESRARVLDSQISGEGALVVLDRTPFFAQAGGQVGDTGWLTAEGKTYRVTDSRWAGEVSYQLLEGKEAPSVGSRVTALVDESRRRAVARSHTATHLLHAGLREVLGEHVTQSGSLVAPDRLRFDFTHFEPLTDEELREVENLVNRMVLECRPVGSRWTDYDEAREAGAIALFGEKYSQEVRVVEIEASGGELCGGTHVDTTGQVGSIIIQSESSVGAGMRRIEALVGLAALEEYRELRDRILQLAELLRCQPGDVVGATRELIAARKDLERQAQKAHQESALEMARRLAREAREVSGSRVVSAEVSLDGDQLKSLADFLRQELESGAVVLASRNQGRVQLLLAATEDLVQRGLHCGKALSQAAREVGGGGGGRPEFAQAGGKNPQGIDRALERAVEEIARMLSQGG